MNGRSPKKKRLTLTVDEAAEALGISRSLAYSLVRTGELPSIRLGNRVVVPIARLQAMLAGEEVAAIS